MKRHLVLNLILITLLVSCLPPSPPATNTWIPTPVNGTSLFGDRETINLPPLGFKMLERNGHMNTKTLKNLVLGFALGSFGLVALAATIPNAFTNGTVISSNAVNQNFSSLNNAVTTLEGKVTALQAITTSICSKDFNITFNGILDFSTKGFASYVINQQIVDNNAILSATWSPTPSDPSTQTKQFLKAIKSLTIYYAQGGTSVLYLNIFPDQSTPASIDATGATINIHEMYVRFDGKCE